MHRLISIALPWGLAVAGIAGAGLVGVVEAAGPPFGIPHVTDTFSPNGDGFRDAAVVEFHPAIAGHIRVEIRNADGQRVATLADRQMSARPHALRWDGMVVKQRSRQVRPAAEGAYSVHIAYRTGRPSVDVPATITVDRAPPRLQALELDVSRAQRAHLVRVLVRTRGAEETWLEWDGQRLVTLRTLPRRVVRAQQRAPRLLIWAGLPHGLTGMDLTAAQLRQKLVVVARDRAGNRTRIGLAKTRTMPRSRRVPPR